MAASSYDQALTRLLAHEGGYTNDAADPGGPTKFGITIYDYRKYVKPGASAADVKAMTVGEAKAIYRNKYWGAQRCDELPPGVDYAVFDYGVNSGIGRSGKVLRRCLKLSDTGSIVDDTVIAAAARADARALIAALCDERLRSLQSLKTWDVFGKGWGRRVAEVKAFSLQLAAGQPAIEPAPDAGVPRGGKGMVPVQAGAQKSSAAAIAAAGALAARQAHASGAGAPLIVGIVTVTLIAALAGWAYWHWRRQKQQEKPA
jgi:lysozyme family protein